METKPGPQDSKYLKKEIGFWPMVMLNVGAMIGSGILILPFSTMAYAGPYIFIPWLIGGFLVLPLILVYNRLIERYPITSGLTRYPYYSHGGLTSFATAMSSIIVDLMTLPVEAEATTIYLNVLWPIFIYKGTPTIAGYIMEVAIIAIIMFIIYIGVKYLAGTNFILTVTKVIIIALFGLVMISFWSPTNFTAPGIAYLPKGISGIFTASAMTIFAYIGFRKTVVYAGEAKNIKVLNKVEYVGWFLTLVIYLVIVIAVVGAIRWDKLAPLAAQSGIILTPGDWAGVSMISGPFTTLAFSLGLAWLAYLFIIDGILSPQAVNLSVMGETVRTFYGAAKTKYLPKIFLRVNPKTGSMPWGILVSFIAGVAFLFIVPLYPQAVILYVSLSAITYISAPAALGGILSRDNPEMKKKEWLHLYIIGPIAMIVSGLIFYWTGFPYTLYAAPIVAILSLILVYYSRKEKGIGGWLNGAWYIAFMLILALISYLGEKDFGGTGLITFPYDFIVIILLSITFYFIAIISRLPEAPEEEADIYV
jgi:amino acid transporter